MHENEIYSSWLYTFYLTLLSSDGRTYSIKIKLDFAVRWKIRQGKFPAHRIDGDLISDEYQTHQVYPIGNL